MGRLAHLLAVLFIVAVVSACGNGDDSSGAPISVSDATVQDGSHAEAAAETSTSNPGDGGDAAAAKEAEASDSGASDVASEQ